MVSPEVQRNAALIVGVLTGLAVSAWATGLRERLYEIDLKRTGDPAQMPGLEKEALELLGDDPSPDDRGTVYAHVGFMYANNGLNPPEHAKRAADYCSRAAQYPLDIQDACYVYLYWGHGIVAQHAKAGVETRAQVRRQAATAYLRGFKRVAEHLAATSMKGAGAHRSLPELRLFRSVFADASRLLYVEEPLAVGELEELARGVLQDAGLVDEILRGLEEGAALEKPPSDPGKRITSSRDVPTQAHGSRPQDRLSPRRLWLILGLSAAALLVASGMWLVIRRRRR